MKASARPTCRMLLFGDDGGSLRVELRGSGSRLRVSAEFARGDAAERFLAALLSGRAAELYGVAAAKLEATDPRRARRFLVSARLSGDRTARERAARFLEGIALGVACAFPAPGPMPLAPA